MNKWIISCLVVILALGGLYLYTSNERDIQQQAIADINRLEEVEKLEKELAEQQIAFNRIRVRADSAKEYCVENGFRTDYCYLVDFKIHSGKNRFFVWDFVKDTIVDAGLCCHGYGDKKNRSSASIPVFSNVPGSLSSSLGHYKVAYRDTCSWGTGFQYRLHGLDKTNSNALVRAVTLHSYGLVPDEEIHPKYIPLGYSQGCFITSDNMLHRLDKMLKDSKQSILIWAYL